MPDAGFSTVNVVVEAVLTPYVITVPVAAAATMLPPFCAATKDFGFSLNLVSTGTGAATLVTTVEPLLFASVSEEVVVALAVLLSVPGAFGTTTIVMFA